jgi:superfamily II DNA/RNA helicase
MSGTARSKLSLFLATKARQSRGDTVQFNVRPYQLRAASQAFRLLRKGANAVIDLPTGAGKTNVAFITACEAFFASSQREAKILYIVPTRILVSQVVAAARWLYPDFDRVGITQSLASSYFRLRGALQRAKIVVSTPGILATLFERTAIDRRQLIDATQFVVVDEFDEFLTIDATTYDFEVRLEHNFERLTSVIESKPLLLMSGTAPNAASNVVKSYTAELYAKYVEKHFQPSRIHIPEATYRRFIPRARVHLLGVTDGFVECCDAALRYRIHRRIADFECEANIDLDTEYLLERLSAISSGFLKKVRTASGRIVPVDDDLKRLARELLGTVNMFTFLFEDMFSGFGVGTARVPKFENCIELEEFIEINILHDGRPRPDEFWSNLRGKATALVTLLKARRGQRAVVFTRYVRLSDALAQSISENMFPVFELDARLSEAQRFAKIRHFNDTPGAVLIITRTTGKRGLDIPSADFAVIYSPKEDEYIVWQELSRIRSTLGKGKDSFILFYSATAEERKLRKLEQDMRHSANRYQFLDSPA